MCFRELQKSNKNTPSVIIHLNKERLNKEFSMTCILLTCKDDNESTKMISKIPLGPVFSGGLGSARLTAGLDYLKDFFQP